ncbi:olfactory receptor 1052-like [Oxyura jamaicensis]|uniref:olfactory receptor 1052-like n=1 Tax=Oxyura jamaicensis TaxID=8884 RepID=UPI0015A5920F|nr:olfactory receptor 1052-like [Oxyura jamaicensis]
MSLAISNLQKLIHDLLLCSVMKSRGRNCTQTVEFSLMGFTGNLEVQLTLFTAFLVVYLMTLLGNLGIIILIRTSPQLHSPMYYFLGNLALVDLLYCTVVNPKLLADLVRQKPLSYAGCVTQILVFGVFLVTECFLLATMAYDRYMAICHPLHYSVLMSPRLCVQLVGGSYLAGLVNGMGQTIGMFNLSFCGSVVVNLFFCDISLLVSLSSSDSTLTSLIITIPTFLFGVSSGLVVLVSYIAIISTILSIRSVEGKCKAFSTCASHLTTVSIFYGNGLFVYFKPSSLKSREEDKWVAVLYTMVTPMLNPLIYSLRNQEVKEALRKLRDRKRT